MLNLIWVHVLGRAYNGSLMKPFFLDSADVPNLSESLT
jgi:hypothetical protein